MNTTAEDVRRRFDASPMSRTQKVAIAVTVALSALDGYDVLSVTFAAPAIARDWNVGKAALGIVLSAGLAGMALGSLMLAPLADRVGRRVLVLGSLCLMAVGMLLSALAWSLPMLAGMRVLTGLGIGAMVAVINPVAAEFANARRRSLALAMMAMGYPAGGLAGGLIAAALLRAFDWRAVFVAGAVAALLLVPVVLRFLPEPLAFLLSGPRPDSLSRVNALLTRCSQPLIASLPQRDDRRTGGYAAIFAYGQRALTLRVTAANLLFVMTVYYVLSWMPQMIVDQGFVPSAGSLVASIANLCGIAGGVTLGAIAGRVGLSRTTVAMMAGLGVATIAFGAAPASLPLLAVSAGLCGYFLFGGIAGIYATLAASFSDEARASGSGFVIGIGRVGSAIAPLLAGFLYEQQLGRGTVSAAFGLLALAAGLLLASSARDISAGSRPAGIR